MPVSYLARRVGIFILIMWLAASVNFFLPRLGGMNPVAEKLMFTAALGGNLHAGMQDMVKEYEVEIRPQQAALGAIPHLSCRHESVRVQLLDRQLPSEGQRHDPRGTAVDLRAPDGDDDHFLRHRQPSRRLSGMARRAAVAAVPDAAAAGAQRHPFLPAWAPPRLPRRLQHAVAPALRRLHGRDRFRSGAFRSSSTWSGTPSCHRLRSSSARSAAGRSGCAR